MSAHASSLSQSLARGELPYIAQTNQVLPPWDLGLGTRIYHIQDLIIPISLVLEGQYLLFVVSGSFLCEYGDC